MTGNDLTVIVPLWRRTANLGRLSESILATVPDAEAIYVVSPDDVEAYNPIAETVPRPGLDRLLVTQWPGGTPGDYARKINAGYRFSDRPLLFTGADDIEFLDGWYEAARPVLHNVVGVVGTNDDCNPRTFDEANPGFPHSTHSLVARWYADLGGAYDASSCIYSEAYVHEYCDDELVGLARARGMYAHAGDSVVRHHHPNAGRAEDDTTYRTGRSGTRRSRQTFQLRRRMWEPPSTTAGAGVTQVHR